MIIISMIIIVRTKMIMTVEMSMVEAMRLVIIIVIVMVMRAKVTVTMTMEVVIEMTVAMTMSWWQDIRLRCIFRVDNGEVNLTLINIDMNNFNLDCLTDSISSTSMNTN